MAHTDDGSSSTTLTVDERVAHTDDGSSSIALAVDERLSYFDDEFFRTTRIIDGGVFSFNMECSGQSDAGLEWVTLISEMIKQIISIQVDRLT